MDLIVEPLDTVWRARFGDGVYTCAIGRGGVVSADEKREGDGATPIGRWRMSRVLYRSDRVGSVETGIPATAIRPDDGWCDDPNDPRYNRQVERPYRANHEMLWREDSLYNIVVVLDHNSDPVIPGRGSAIFLHVARDDFGPTEGCVALALPVLRHVLQKAGNDGAVVVRIR